ncbi:MAG: AgmX/PglI C-terminal domain-containing protein [Bacteroidetes bacterium]|nr:AgmX/PglI C-terminal domain-containing protein [Bacteroidota bacterium]
MKKIWIIALLLTTVSPAAFSQIYGGHGKLSHTVTSFMPPQGNYFLGIESFSSFVPVTYTDKSLSNGPITSNYLLFDYAISDFAMTTFGFNVFQMNRFVDEATTGLGPVTFSVKLGNIEFMNSALRTGFLITSTFSVGKQNNILFNPYYSGALEFGLWNYWSYYFNTELIKQSESVHLNIGMITHNENQLEYSNNTTSYEIPGRSVGIKYMLGYQYPFGAWKFSGELWGEQFFKQPDPIIYSRESYAYLNGGVSYRFDLWELRASADLLLLGYTDETDYTKGALYGYPQPTTSAMNYSPFFIQVGFNLNLSDIVNGWMGYETAVYNYDRVKKEDYTTDLRRDDILTKIELEYYRDLYSCFKAARRYDESLQGTLYVDFVVKEDGTVGDHKIVVSTFDSAFGPQLEECMMSEVTRWTFPKGDKPIRFEIVPLNFR